MLEIRDEALFARFLALCAALTAQEVNHSQLGRDLDISSPTAQKWLAVLRATYQWFDLPAFSGNTVKHVSQKPKGTSTASVAAPPSSSTPAKNRSAWPPTSSPSPSTCWRERPSVVSLK